MGAKCVLANIITSLLGDFHLLKLTDIPIRCDFLSYIQRIASFYRKEICGVISKNSLFFVKNSSPEPFQTFYIDPVKYLDISKEKKAIDKYELRKIFKLYGIYKNHALEDAYIKNLGCKL